MVTKSVTDSTKIRKGLSKKEAYLLSSLSEKKKELFVLKDVMEELDCNYNHAKVIVSRLMKKKWVLSLEKGKYLIVPIEAGKESVYTEQEFVIASRIVHPYYIAYWSALNFHGMTEQIPFTVFIATTKRRKSRKIHNLNYVFVTLSKNKFFGHVPVNISGKIVQISDKEKTIADCLDHLEYCGGITEIAKAIWNAREEIDFEKIVTYAIKMKNKTIIKRLGYLSQKLGINLSRNVIEKMKRNISKGYSLLDTAMKRRGKFNSEWKLVVNVSDKDLIEWKAVY